MIRVVAPFRPLPLEGEHQLKYPDFDWMDAIRMMTDSVERTCGCSVHVLTDVDTDLPMPALQYETTHRRLMLWFLEVSLRYLESDDFTCDTVLLDADQLVYNDLARWFAPRMDLGLIVRKHSPKNPAGFRVLNGVQWFAVKAKDRLVDFYRQALAIAESLPDPLIAWGADTIALEQLIEPLDPNVLVDRCGVRVRMIKADDVIEALTATQVRHLEAGRGLLYGRDVVDFRGPRKPYMRPFYEATILREQVA